MFRLLRSFFIALCCAVFCYYFIGICLTHRIVTDSLPNDDKNGTALSVVMADVIERETGKHVYAPEVPSYSPTAVLDNMPAFQRGIIFGAARSVAALSDDAKAKEAAALLDERTGCAADFKKAAVLLRESAGVPDEKRLIAAVSGLIEDAQRRLSDHIVKREMYFIDLKADDVFFFTKGELYTAFLALSTLKPTESVDNALFYLKKAFTLQPTVVLNVSPASQFAPNHLTGAGFFAGRALEALHKAENKRK